LNFYKTKPNAPCTTHHAPWASNAVSRYEDSPSSPVPVILIKVIYVCLVSAVIGHYPATFLAQPLVALGLAFADAV
jgi:hypothetical protein